MSRCGRFFCCDGWQGAVVCESKTSRGRAQNTHPYAYLTPDLRWAILNSERSGSPHIHAASVPEGMIDHLSKA